MSKQASSNMLLQLICLVFFCVPILSQTTIGRSCTTPNRNSGTCLDINNCPSLLNLLMNQSSNNTVRSFLRSSVCEYVNQSPVVCCPQQATSSKLPTTPNCGFSNVTNPRVVNGVPAKLGEFPWIAVLGYRNTKNLQQPKWLCGGSLITNKHVLTAAHCVYKRTDLYIVRLGDLDLFSDEDGARPSIVEVSKVTIHDNFNPTRYTNDIALITLKEAVNNPTIWPICLPVNAPYRSMSYLNFSPTLAGWGSITFNGPSSSTLQQIFVPVLDNQVCQTRFGSVATIDDKILCAGSLNGDKDACGGDSGGPLMHEISEGTNYRIYQIGIVSYGFRCAVAGYPGVYTRVTAFIDWINQNVN